MKLGAGHASCYSLSKRRRGWTELVTRQRFPKLKTKFSNNLQNKNRQIFAKLKTTFSNASDANTAEEMDVCKDEEEEGRREIDNDGGRMVDLELVCKHILLGLVSAAVEAGEFNQVDF